MAYITAGLPFQRLSLPTSYRNIKVTDSAAFAAPMPLPHFPLLEMPGPLLSGYTLPADLY